MEQQERAQDAGSSGDEPHDAEAARRTRLEVALAAAEERVLRTHGASAGRFLAAVGPEIPLNRALGIYFRLVGVPDRDRRTVRLRALAELADRWRGGLDRLVLDGGNGMIPSLSRRIRGRRQERLRVLVSASAAAARDAVRRAYLGGVADVAAALGADAGPAVAAQFFIDRLQIAPPWQDRLFHEALAHLEQRAA
jgi:hypothetical protein